MDFIDTIMLRYKNIFERENGMPVSVIEKTSVIEWHPPFDTRNRAKRNYFWLQMFKWVGTKSSYEEKLGMTLRKCSD
jgi:hypothetical protein